MSIPVQYTVPCHRYTIESKTLEARIMHICDCVDGGLNRAIYVRREELTGEGAANVMLMMAAVQGVMLGLGYLSSKPHEDDCRLERAMTIICAEVYPDATVTRISNTLCAVTTSDPSAQKLLEAMSVPAEE